MRLTGNKLITLLDKEYDDLEQWYPTYRVREEVLEVHLVAL
ncbi:hypothetical protein [Paenibacillus sp. D2_2]